MASSLYFDPQFITQAPYIATQGSAGLDLSADLESPVTVSPNSIVVIPTGCYSVIQSGAFGMVCSRSGLATNGIMVVNAPGIIDSDYRGEIKVILGNIGNTDHVVNPGDRIAQLILVDQCGVPFSQVVIGEKPPSDTERGSGGFGSTGA